MASQRGARSGAVEDLFAAVDPAEHDGPGALLPHTVLHALTELVPCEVATFQVMDEARRWVTAQQYDTTSGTPDAPVEPVSSELVGTASDDAELLDLFWRGFAHSAACSYPQRTGDRTVTRLSDFCSRRALAASDIGAYFAEVGVRHELLVPLPPQGRLDHRVVLFRLDGPDFTAHDVMLMTLLRPHLWALHLRQRRRRQGIPDVTPRQLQLLTLIAAGCTNQQVARALGVSEGTVRKHLENIFARLDVTSRTAAAAKVIPFLDNPGDHGVLVGLEPAEPTTAP